MDSGKDLLLLPYTYIPSTGTVDLLLHLQHYQRCEPMVLKMCAKSKFVLCQSRYYNLLTEKTIRKFIFLKYSFFEHVPLLSISRNVLETTSLDDIFLGNFTLSNSFVLVEELIRWNRGFEIVLIDHYAREIGNENITGKYLKNYCNSFTNLIRSGSVHTGCYVYNSLVHIPYFL